MSKGSHGTWGSWAGANTNGIEPLSAGAVYVSAEAVGAEVVKARTDGVGAVGAEVVSADTTGAAEEVGMVASRSDGATPDPIDADCAGGSTKVAEALQCPGM